MSTSAAAVSLSTIAILEAGQAKTIACNVLAQGYQHSTATVAQQQQYAACVERMYPESISPEAAMALKVLIVLLIVSVPFGAWRAHRDAGDWTDAAMAALIAPLIVGTIAAFLFLAYVGICFILA